MKQRSHTQWRHLCLLLVHFLLIAQNCNAQQFLAEARLVDVRAGNLSGVVVKLASGRGLLSDGTEYSFGRWYKSNWFDLRFTLMSPISENLGVYWGFGTGERGEKYQIDPSLALGFIATEPITDNSFVSLSVRGVLGGFLTEKSCTADYGAIGGVQRVNCRMAGSLLPPAETLNFLLNEPPDDQLSIMLRYQLNF